ncbi:uncharacterized protein L969DRAFT_97114 [Mixia osmundae IAM 14324]|uniref:Alginate lyase domain-containing protein n=1 Tax=Mixia osmundae (strain CBS 9802 / IAM 14324 / JCM 22182 / KY 12970) TaxID=764103 RepID=G7E1Q6_MIXOS|nr:uncharacterized protein L969DRAFT_97114 [Mixia osmundae IAM 14324]KEI36716.1 hypothetical protein L969DRAFT_97114 [Mixia osmundae IAM 14324]GAA96766.1 hypothetical protein E5Q_03437 [Mixia osmundae IAM 14324]
MSKAESKMPSTVRRALMDVSNRATIPTFFDANAQATNVASATGAAGPQMASMRASGASRGALHPLEAASNHALQANGLHAPATSEIWTTPQTSPMLGSVSPLLGSSWSDISRSSSISRSHSREHSSNGTSVDSMLAPPPEQATTPLLRTSSRHLSRIASRDNLHDSHFPQEINASLLHTPRKKMVQSEPAKETVPSALIPASLRRRYRQAFGNRLSLSLPRTSLRSRLEPTREQSKPAKVAKESPARTKPSTWLARQWRQRAQKRSREWLWTYLGGFGLLGLLLCTLLSTQSRIRPVAQTARYAVSSQRVAKRSAKWPQLLSAKPSDSYDAPERDTLILYRILGNDLPPRHEQGQTMRNVRFMLEHEHSFDEEIARLLSLQHAEHVASGSRKRTRQNSAALPVTRIEKYFVLNRLSSPAHIAALTSLLMDELDVPQDHVLQIPFDWDAYYAQSFRWDGGVGGVNGRGMESVWGIGSARPGNLSSAAGELKQRMDNEADLIQMEGRTEAIKQERRRLMAKLRAIDYTYHDKNNYAINNNGGRNFALAHGRSQPRARWILPLDGNCFFTPAAMASVLFTLQTEGEGASARHHVVIPMVRLLNNKLVLHQNRPLPSTVDVATAKSFSSQQYYESFLSPPSAPEEPQIGFRYDSLQTYQPAMRYGRRSKLEMLWRLGAVPFARGLDRKSLPWEVSERTYLTANAHGSIHRLGDQTEDSLDFSKAGWVYRLFSGDRSQEISSTEANQLRYLNRIKGIVAFVERLDEQVARGMRACPAGLRDCGFSKDRLWSWSEERLEELKHAYDEHEDFALDRVLRFESQAMQSLTYEDTTPDPASDPHTAAVEAAELALAGYLTSNVTYSVAAAQLIQTRFLTAQIQDWSHAGRRSAATADGSGYAFPLSSLGHRPTWLPQAERAIQLPFDAKTFDPSLLLDAVRLIRATPSLHAPIDDILSSEHVHTLVASHLVALLFDHDLQELTRYPDDLGQAASYDLHLASLAAFLDDAKLLGRVSNRARLRTASHGFIDPQELTAASRSVYRLRHGLLNVRYRASHVATAFDSSYPLLDPGTISSHPRFAALELDA